MKHVLGLLSFIFASCLPAWGGGLPSQITVHAEPAAQVIDGFGVAQAGWADQLFLFENREQVIDALFGENGLKLNLLRGEVFPHYSEKPGSYRFDLQADTGRIPAAACAPADLNELLRRGQAWLVLRVRDRYPQTRFLFSTWSPPAWMKSNGAVSDGRLKPECYPDFAAYLAAFCRAFQSAGVPPYAVSPSNEPGYAAPWNSCLWTAGEMGDFIDNFLIPALQKENIDTRILFGENPLWSVVHPMLAPMSSADFVSTVLQQHPGLTRYPVIAAGHGYVLPDTLSRIPTGIRKTPVIPFTETEKHRIPVWVTEISDTDPLDTSMRDGLKWAATFHRYLTEGRVNGFVWWAGAQPTGTNESLIILDKNRREYGFAKRYDTFGNYTRYIPSGSRRVETEQTGLPAEVKVSAFCRHGRYTVVVVNPTGHTVKCRLRLESNPHRASLESYTTDKTRRWEAGTVPYDRAGYSLALPPESVVTYIR